MTPKKLMRISVVAVVAGIVLGLVASWMTRPRTDDVLFAAPEFPALDVAVESPGLQVADEAPDGGTDEPEPHAPAATDAPEPQDPEATEPPDLIANPDSDGDGIADPDDEDDDNDGLPDGKEAVIGTDPLDKDTDNDFYSDGTEHEAGTDPLDKSDHPNNDIQLP